MSSNSLKVLISLLSTLFSGLSMAAFVGCVEDWRWTGLTTVNYKPNWSPVLLASSPPFNNILLLVLFGLQHSIMARPTVKSFITSILRINDTVYPSIYALTASLVLLALSQCWIPITSMHIWSLDYWPIMQYTTQAVSIICWLLAGVAVMSIDRFQLCGGEPLMESLFGKANVEKWLPKPQELITTGVYAIVRHPAMLFMILGIWIGPVMTIGHLCLSIVLTVYIVIAVHYFEEPQLVELFGNTYKQYMKDVPYQVIPGLK